MPLATGRSQPFSINCFYCAGIGMRNQIVLLLLLIVNVFMLNGCAVRSPKAHPALVHTPASAPVVTSAPVVHSVTRRKTKMKSLLAHLRLGLTQKTVHLRVGRPDEGITSPLSMAGWTYDTDIYNCADGTFMVEYADSPPMREPDTARVICITGPTFDIGRCRP